MKFQNTLAFAKQLDKKDRLKKFRKEFLFPEKAGTAIVYFCGNSLGLQPKRLHNYIEQELNDWAQWGVDAHLRAKNPWYSYHEILSKQAAKVVGALPSEVVMMNQLTVNLHLLLVSFYRPSADGKRKKILCEATPFPSDRYALESQIKFHGYDPEECLVEIQPRKGEYILRTTDILQEIEKHREELALVFLGGVNYYTGQFFDIKKITSVAHKFGIPAGFDLAHAAGNVSLRLHDWDVDFACWCTYKYLNSGPGGVGGVFVHRKHESSFDLPRFSGWWGHDKKTRFNMEKKFRPMKGAEGWQVSNSPVLSMAVHKASLDIFSKAGMERLVSKSRNLTGYLEFVLNEIRSGFPAGKEPFRLITPADPDQRGCQVSVLVYRKGIEIYNLLIQSGAVVDRRHPGEEDGGGVIRIAPVPLYNSFADVFRFGSIFKEALNKITKFDA